jgi:hypothetical protein
MIKMSAKPERSGLTREGDKIFSFTHRYKFARNCYIRNVDWKIYRFFNPCNPIHIKYFDRFFPTTVGIYESKYVPVEYIDRKFKMLEEKGINTIFKDTRELNIILGEERQFRIPVFYLFHTDFILDDGSNLNDHLNNGKNGKDGKPKKWKDDELKELATKGDIKDYYIIHPASYWRSWMNTERMIRFELGMTKIFNEFRDLELYKLNPNDKWSNSSNSKVVKGKYKQFRDFVSTEVISPVKRPKKTRTHKLGLLIKR